MREFAELPLWVGEAGLRGRSPRSGTESRCDLDRDAQIHDVAASAHRELEPSSLMSREIPGPEDEDAGPPEDATSPETRVSAPLGLGPAYLAKAESLRRRFQTPGRTDVTGEQILEELVAAETPIAMALQDAEAALVSLLHKTITDPNLALAVMKLLKETVTVSSAVRRRIENSLGAVANLRTQREFLERRGR